MFPEPVVVLVAVLVAGDDTVVEVSDPTGSLTL